VNVGTIQGGTSINTISSHAHLDLDLRSEVPEALDEFDLHLEQIFARYQSGDVKVTKQHIGSRPGGEIPAAHGLVRLACNALKAADVAECRLGIASTDANVPLSKGFPSICVGLTQGGDAHTTHEYIDLETIPNGYIMLMHLLQGALDGDDTYFDGVPGL
jgi:di/tripeptidase